MSGLGVAFSGALWGNAAAVLVLIAAPILFLAMPDGIPLVYAGCASGSAANGAATENSKQGPFDCVYQQSTMIDAGIVEYVASPSNCSFTLKVNN